MIKMVLKNKTKDYEEYIQNNKRYLSFDDGGGKG